MLDPGRRVPKTVGQKRAWTSLTVLHQAFFICPRLASAPQSDHDAPLLRIGSIGPGMSVEYYLRATSREGPNPHNLLELVKAPRMQAPLAGVGGLD
jgi:hypothetical protein